MLTPMKAIRAKCLDCCCGSSEEVKLCPCEDCPLHEYRFGHKPYVNHEMTPARLAALQKLQDSRKKTANAEAELTERVGEGNYTPEA